MSKRILIGLIGTMLVVAACGCSLMVFADSGQEQPGPKSKSDQPRVPLPKGKNQESQFLGHLAVKGMMRENKKLMVSIEIHPKLWEPIPYVLFDEVGFGRTYSHDDPMSINVSAIRQESVFDAKTSRHFFSNNPMHVMVNTEGWSPQYDHTLRSVKKDTPETIYNRHALRVHEAIQSGIEEGWPNIDRFGWWSKVVDIEIERRWQLEQSALETNLQAASMWRRTSYIAARVYPFTRLIPEGQTPGEYEAGPEEWAAPFRDIVQASIDLRNAIGGNQLVLPCMFGTSMVGPGYGKGKGRWGFQNLTEGERRLLVRTCYEAGADGIMVWQPMRSVAERDEFQRALGHIEAELARINGISDLGPSITLGELFNIRSDWPGRPMDWMREYDWKWVRPSPVTPAGR